MIVERPAGDLRITRKWRSTAAIGLVVFAAVWDAGIVLWLLWFAEDALLFCFSLPFIFFAVIITYFMFCLLLNCTVIETSRGLLSVRHSPLPWPGKRLPLLDVDHLYCQEHVSTSDESTTVDYLLQAVTKGGKKIKLLSVRDGPEHVVLIAQLINDWLQAGDR
jgi:hypothetical protein